MKKAKTCIICGETTTALLFNDKWLGIPLCSRKCENEYLSTLTPVKKEQIDKVKHINDLIKGTKRFETMCWAIAGLGLLIMATAYLVKDATIFLIGIIPLTLGALSTGYFEKQLNKLASQKRQIVI